MKNFLTVAFCVFAAASGCKKKDENKPATAASTTEAPGTPGTPAGSGTMTATPGASPTTGSADTAAATPTAKAEYKPDEIFKATAGKSHMDLMDMFKDNATVTGTVKEVKDDPTGEYNIVFDAGDGHTVTAMLNDPKPARDKKLKAGDTVTVTACGVANPTDKDLPLRACTLK